jgi:hypothetical protein
MTTDILLKLFENSFSSSSSIMSGVNLWMCANFDDVEKYAVITGKLYLIFLGKPEKKVGICAYLFF